MTDPSAAFSVMPQAWKRALEAFELWILAFELTRRRRRFRARLVRATTLRRMAPGIGCRRNSAATRLTWERPLARLERELSHEWKVTRKVDESGANPSG